MDTRKEQSLKKRQRSKYMEKYKKIPLILLILLVVGITLVSNVSALQDYDQRVYKVGSTTYKQEVCDTPNTYSYNNYYQNSYNSYYLQHNSYQNYNSWNYYNRKTNVPTTRLSYTKTAYEDTRKSIFGDYVKEYVVEIKNTGYAGRYFTVKFELKNKNGYTYIQTVTHYLRDGERQKFVYRDIQYERHEVLDWNYIITPGMN